MEQKNPRFDNDSSVDAFRQNLRDFVFDDEPADDEAFAAQEEEAVFGSVVDADDFDFGTIDLDALTSSESSSAAPAFDAALDVSVAGHDGQRASGPEQEDTRAVRGKHAAQAAGVEFLAGFDESSGDPDAAAAAWRASQQASSKRRSSSRVIVAVVLAVAVLAAAAVAWFMLGNGKDASQPTALQTTVQSAASSEPAKLAFHVEVKADGYDEHASTLMYRIEGRASEDSSNAASSSGAESDASSEGQAQVLIRYGIVDASRITEDGTFEVDIDNLPAGAYTVSWSNAILADGTCLLAPEPINVNLLAKDRSFDVEFSRVEGATVSADQAKSVYDSVIAWLAEVESESEAERSSIMPNIASIAAQARENIERAASVQTAGGIDRVGVQEEESDEAADDSDDGYATPATSYTYTYSNGGSTGATASDSAEEPTYSESGNEGSGDSGDYGGDSAGGDSSGDGGSVDAGSGDGGDPGGDSGGNYSGDSSGEGFAE